MFCEPASAASVAGLLKYGADGAEQVVCVLTGRGIKDPQTAIEHNGGAVIPLPPTLGRSKRRFSVESRASLEPHASIFGRGSGGYV